ncbi:MAG: DUF2971 domain-containing protein [Candidatus Glassbacteria bacterium]|nr:DUF2971 domain-containing protein [Candidatus Glassbacteria bacterium]
MSYKAKPVYLFNPVRSTPQIREAIESFFRYWLPIHTEEEELNLFHYTTQEGLTGILHSRSIWCSDISTLNDPEELQYGKKLVDSKLKENIAKESNDHIVKLLKRIEMHVNDFDTYHKVYIACFCENDNLLSQWRIYASRGGGFNLGLSINDNTKYSHNVNDIGDTSYIILRKIIYEYSHQEDIISKYISNIMDGSKKALAWFDEHGCIPEAWADIAALESINVLIDIVTTLKNPVFHEEKEWRLIKFMEPDFRLGLLNFRNVNNSITPYLNTFLYEDAGDKMVFPLKKIKIGPMLEEDSTKEKLKLLVKSKSEIQSKIYLDEGNVEISGAGFSLRS